MKFQIEIADIKHSHAVNYFQDLLTKEHELDGFTEEQFLRSLFDEDSIVFIATTMENKAIGFIHARKENDQTIIHHIFAEKEVRQHEVERYLIEMIERWASSLHSKQVISPNELEIFKQLGYESKLNLQIKEL